MFQPEEAVGAVELPAAEEEARPEVGEEEEGVGVEGVAITIRIIRSRYERGSSGTSIPNSKVAVINK